MRVLPLLCAFVLVGFVVSAEMKSFKLTRKEESFANYCTACLDPDFVTYANYYQNDEILMALPMHLLPFPCSQGKNITVGCHDACIRIEIFKNYDGLGRSKEGSLYDCSTGIYRKHINFPQGWNFTNVRRSFGITHHYPGNQITMVYDYYLNNKRFWTPKVENPITKQINKMVINNAFRGQTNEIHWIVYPILIVVASVFAVVYLAITNLGKKPKIQPFDVIHAEQADGSKDFDIVETKPLSAEMD